MIQFPRDSAIELLHVLLRAGRYLRTCLILLNLVPREISSISHQE